MGPLEVLKEAEFAAAEELPPGLGQVYGGGLSFQAPVLIANFVSSLDGVVDLPGSSRVGRILSGDSPGDRFVMGLLRACADAVLIGAGTLRASPRSTWAPDQAFPEGARDFWDLRQQRRLAPRPRVVVVTRGGNLDPSHPGLRGALIATGAQGAARLPPELGSEVLTLPDGPTGLDLGFLLERLVSLGYRTVLSEAGPSLTGVLVAEGLLDELFLTVSPLLAGWPVGGGRTGMAGEVQLLPERQVGGRLLSVRRQGSHLFLRYRFVRADGKAHPAP